MFAPISVGKDKVVSISHLFYADDAIFIGKWSNSNVNVLMMMLHCFSLASGLKINVHKSSLYGVGVSHSHIQDMADKFGCMANNLPFTYLGVKVGSNMSRINAWDDIVQKVVHKLSNWKAKTLSVGGRLTLIKSVLGSLPTYYMSLFKIPDGVLSHLNLSFKFFFLGSDLEDAKMTWVSWRKVMAHKQYGGLGVSSLFALNRALLFKWIWRFLTNEAGLWLNVVKVIHGDNGSLAHSPPSRFGCSVWIGELKAIDSLKSRGVDLMEFCNKVIGNGNNSMFWQDTWLGQVCLRKNFP
ncbi:hypothetical protein Tco_1439666 [Tanacetum coccineum]